MTRKRRTAISGSEAVLEGVIRALETDDSPFESEDPEQVIALARVYHDALMDLLRHGPLVCQEAIADEESESPPLQPTDVAILRAELLQLFRSSVRGAKQETSSSPIRLDHPPTFTVRLIGGQSSVAATGAVRDLVILQAVHLLQDVGLVNVCECLAPDCRRLFVKAYRREFCSAQCQKRINTRKQRQTAKDLKERLARRRRQRRKKGTY